RHVWLKRDKKSNSNERGFALHIKPRDRHRQKRDRTREYELEPHHRREAAGKLKDCGNKERVKRRADSIGQVGRRGRAAKAVAMSDVERFVNIVATVGTERDIVGGRREQHKNKTQRKSYKKDCYLPAVGIKKVLHIS